MSQAPAPPPPLSKSQWMILLLLALVQFTNVLDFVIMMPLAPQFHREWNLTAREFGFLVSCYAYAAALSGIISSWFIDKIDRKVALLGIYLLFAIANFLCAEAPTYTFMLLARAVAGLSGGVLGGVVLAIVGDLVPYSRRGMATGIIMSSFAVASIIGIPLGLILAKYYTWRITFFGLAGMCVILLVLIWRNLPQVRDHIVQKPRQSPWLTTWTILTDPHHLRGYILMGSLIMTTFILVPYMPSYLVANVGIHEDDVKYIYLFGGLGTLITMTPIGRLADRYGKLRVFQVLAFLALFPLLAVTHLPPVPLYVVLMVTTSMMIFTAGRGVPAMAMVTACTTNERRGGFMSVLGAVQQLAMGLATTVGGLILGVQVHAEQTGVAPEAIEPITGFPIVGWIAAVMCLLSVYLGSRLRSVETNTVPKTDIAPDEAMLAVEMEMT